MNWTGFLLLSEDCFGQFAALVFDNPFEKNTALGSLIFHSKHRLKNTAMKADQFVPICSMEMNSSPVFPGYWPSQWRPPANPYTENEGGGRGLKWEGGRDRESWGRYNSSWWKVDIDLMCCKGVEESWGRGQSGRRGMNDTGTGVYSWDLNQRADPRADPVVVCQSLPAS